MWDLFGRMEHPEVQICCAEGDLQTSLPDHQAICGIAHATGRLWALPAEQKAFPRPKMWLGTEFKPRNLPELVKLRTTPFHPLHAKIQECCEATTSRI